MHLEVLRPIIRKERMQVKYIVYYQKNAPVPEVDIWKTMGEITHPVYARKYGIEPKNISSEGYLNFNPFLKKWILEHYQIDDGIPAKTFKELIHKKRLEKRDRLLVRKKIHQTPFLEDKQLQKETWEENKKLKLAFLKLLLNFQHN